MIDPTVEILLVEDNPTDAELALRALRRHKVSNRIGVMRDGAEAIEYLFGDGQSRRPAMSALPRVVLLDLKLPKVDGLEILRRIKETPATRKVPVVVLTSSREDCDLEEAYRLGVNSFIVKPIEFERFATVVRDLGLYWLRMNETPSSI